MSIITLTTDFGIEDEYAGVMKGVILTVHPSATIVDISHHIRAQDLIQAAYSIKASYSYFPPGTVHIVVVDPGVGSERPILAFEKKGYFFLAPDNGVLSLLFDEPCEDTMVHVKNRRFFLESISQTFQGRDVFAPVGAHMSKGVQLTELGDVVNKDQVEDLNIPKPARSNNEVTGQVISIDRFGNLISNIDISFLQGIHRTASHRSVEIRFGTETIYGLSKNYQESKKNRPLALIGSRGTLEIAINKKSAKKHFKAREGDIIKVFIKN